MSFLSKSCGYGLRAVIYITLCERGGSVERTPIKHIAEDLDISFHFLTKILQTLTHAGLINSFRGPKGGVSLARPTDAITLLQIVEALDGPELFTSCILRIPGCGERKPCPLHEAWGKERERLRLLFESTDLESLVASMGSVDQLSHRDPIAHLLNGELKTRIS